MSNVYRKILSQRYRFNFFYILLTLKAHTNLFYTFSAYQEFYELLNYIVKLKSHEI